MLRALSIAIFLAAPTVALGAGAGAAVAATPAPAYSSKSMVGDLLDNPETKAVLNKYIPQIVSNPMIEQGRGLPLEGIAQFEPTLTPEVLAKIDTDLATVKKK